MQCEKQIWVPLVLSVLLHLPVHAGYQNATPEEFPYVGLIHAYDPNKAGEHKFVQCAGTIISTLSVLTACQCLADVTMDKPIRMFEPSKSTVTVGTIYRNHEKEENGTAQIYKADSFRIHPKCRRLNITILVTFDVGIFDISATTPIQYNSAVSSVARPPNGALGMIHQVHEMETFKPWCVLIGWGMVSPDRLGTPEEFKGSANLRKLIVHIQPSDICKKNVREKSTNRSSWSSFQYFDPKEGRFICAFSSDTTALTTQDLGSPVICWTTIVAVVTNQLENTEDAARLNTFILSKLEFSLETFKDPFDIEETTAVTRTTRRRGARKIEHIFTPFWFGARRTFGTPKFSHIFTPFHFRRQGATTELTPSSASGSPEMMKVSAIVFLSTFNLNRL